MYVAGPLIDAAIAVGCAIILRGRGGDSICHAAGFGVLTAGRLEQKDELAQDIEKGNAVPPGSRRPAQTRTRNRHDSGLMRIISDEIESFLNDEVLGSATALSRRAADRFVGLPIA